MSPDLPFPEHLDLTPGLDGYRLFFHGEVIGQFSTLTNAARALTAARQALAMTDGVFAAAVSEMPQ